MTVPTDMQDIFSYNTITCCQDCTPETGRAAVGEGGRNCHEYCTRYLEQKAKRDKEIHEMKEKQKSNRDIIGCNHAIFWDGSIKKNRRAC